MPIWGIFPRRVNINGRFCAGVMRIQRQSIALTGIERQSLRSTCLARQNGTLPGLLPADPSLYPHLATSHLAYSQTS